MKRTTTRELLQRTALQMFADKGYESVSVTAIANAAGVSHMTFFRHFPTKESVVVGDLFDPALAAAVAAQPTSSPPLRRAVRGLVEAMASPEATQELASAQFVQRVRLAATTPTLRGAVWASTRATEDALFLALAESASATGPARAAAGAAIGAATAVLLDWAASEAESDPVQALRDGLTSLLGELA